MFNQTSDIDNSDDTDQANMDCETNVLVTQICSNSNMKHEHNSNVKATVMLKLFSNMETILT